MLGLLPDVLEVHFMGETIVPSVVVNDPSDSKGVNIPIASYSTSISLRLFLVELVWNFIQKSIAVAKGSGISLENVVSSTSTFLA